MAFPGVVYHGGCDIRSSRFRDNFMESALEESFLTQKTESFSPGCIFEDFQFGEEK